MRHLCSFSADASPARILRRRSGGLAVGVLGLVACAACSGVTEATASGAQSEDALKTMHEQVSAELEKRVKPEPAALPMPRGAMRGRTVLQELRAITDSAKRRQRWDRVYAGKPTMGQGLLILQAQENNPLEEGAPPVTAYYLDVDRDQQADVTAIFFETDADRIPHIANGEWLWYEGRLHEYDDSSGRLMLRIGAYKLVER